MKFKVGMIIRLNDKHSLTYQLTQEVVVNKKHGFIAKTTGYTGLFLSNAYLQNFVNENNLEIVYCQDTDKYERVDVSDNPTQAQFIERLVTMPRASHAFKACTKCGLYWPDADDCFRELELVDGCEICTPVEAKSPEN